MKILITGKTSYVGNSIARWLLKNGFQESEVSFLSLREESWKEQSFQNVDTIVHCAALVHKNQAEHALEEYKKINTELTGELAAKAKADGVGQFVFMSTKGVYGKRKSCYGEVIVDENTPLKPFRKYGVSKYEAEKLLQQMEDDTFKVAIIRSPLIYGNNCTGNYKNLRHMVLKYRFVPKIPSRISMIYIDNLCELIRGIIVQRRSGIFLPQNLPIHSSAELAVLIAKYNRKKILYTSLFNPLVRVLSKRIPKINSAFGSSHYRDTCSMIEGIDYQVVGFEESVKRTEGADDKA